jgi:DNA-binding NtrC family response regulator
MTGAPASILVVDDDRDTRANLADILEDVGYRVDVAYDGPSALELVRRMRYDVALLDLKLPGMEGLELCRGIRARQPGTVAIVVTAYAAGETADEARQAGAWEIVPKPVDMPRLLRLVDEATGQPVVLVVDDDADLCRSLWDVLHERRYRAWLAHDVDEAARRLREGTFDVVLADLKLPRGDGVSVLRTVRQTNPAARVVVITGYRTELASLVDLALREGADAVCYKPFDMGRLLETLARLAPAGK